MTLSFWGYLIQYSSLLKVDDFVLRITALMVGLIILAHACPRMAKQASPLEAISDKRVVLDLRMQTAFLCPWKCR